MKEWLCGQARLDEATFMVSFASGAVSGTVSWGSRVCMVLRLAQL